MNWTPRPTGTWTFERRDREVDLVDASVVDDVVELVATAARILDRHRLLRPVRLTLDDWVRIDDPSVESGEVSAPLSVDPADDRAMRELVASLGGSGRLPTWVTLSGTTVVIGSDGTESRVDGAIEISGFAFIWVALDVSTYVDVWLPHDLNAVPQPELYERNAPRLATALEELSRLPGIHVLDSDVTDYATVGGFWMVNHTDAHGEVVPVLESR